MLNNTLQYKAELGNWFHSEKTNLIGNELEWQTEFVELP